MPSPATSIISHPPDCSDERAAATPSTPRPSACQALLRDLQRGKFRWTTFAAIEGNEFDLIAR
jgi:hypothetical protein